MDLTAGCQCRLAFLCRAKEEDAPGTPEGGQQGEREEGAEEVFMAMVCGLCRQDALAG